MLSRARKLAYSSLGYNNSFKDGHVTHHSDKIQSLGFDWNYWEEDPFLLRLLGCEDMCLEQPGTTLNEEPA